MSKTNKWTYYRNDTCKAIVIDGINIANPNEIYRVLRNQWARWGTFSKEDKNRCCLIRKYLTKIDTEEGAAGGY